MASEPELEDFEESSSLSAYVLEFDNLFYTLDFTDPFEHIYLFGNMPRETSPNSSTVATENTSGSNLYGAMESIEKFNGQGNAHEFLEVIELTGQLYSWDDTTKVNVCKLKLRGRALELINTDQVWTWNELKEKLLSQFTSKLTPFQAMQRFQSTFQKSGESIKDYALRIERAGRRTIELTADPNSNALLQKTLKEHMHIQLLNGMLPYVRDKVVLRGTTDYDDAVKVAQEVESNMKTWKRADRWQQMHFNPATNMTNGFRGAAQPPRLNHNFYPRRPNPSNQSSPCPNCGQMGHRFPECRAPARCFGCHETGHIRRQCPKNGMNPASTPARR